MFKKILVANRGEIALRVIRACREMDIATVAVYSQCDATSLHVRFADEAICIGPPAAKDSYLNIPNVLSAADITGADAVHPGYGFLAENQDFARKVADHDMVFIGPSVESLAMFGDKLSAKAAGLPLLPGSEGAIASADEAVQIAEKIGFPLMLKAAAGGGGKGMRVVETEEQLRSVFE
ncbi:MAG: biotin carboxylase N-terminal domain-containing protein, partial [Myxococcota bacterium]|nr:biotin carboxylase N-terminal domain-containing protein [Myxococcota bacterium]